MGNMMYSYSMKRTLLAAFIVFLIGISSVLAVDNFALGKSAFNKKNYRMANTYLVRYLTENPNDANARYYYAQTQYYLGNYDQARIEYGYVIQLAPGTVLANYSQTSLAYLDKMQGGNKAKNDTPANNSVKESAKETTFTSNDNYLVNALSEDGELDTWNPNQMPIPVYINLSNRPKDVYVKCVKDALEVWQAVSGGHISFYYVKDPAYANVIVNISGAPPKSEKGVLGYTTPVTQDGFIKSARLELYSLDPTYKAVAPVDFYNVALHEAGHLVGISGHSENQNDIMFPAYDKNNNAGAKQTLSARDINTLNAMYSLDKNPYATSINSVNRVLGDKNTRLNSKIQENEDYVKRFPNNPTGYCNLGKAYLEQGKTDEAIQAYNKALTVSPNDIYANQSLAKIYYEKNDFKKAETYYKNIIRIMPKGIDAYCNLTNIYIKTNRIQLAKSTMATLSYRNKNAENDPVVASLRKQLGMGN